MLGIPQEVSPLNAPGHFVQSMSHYSLQRFMCLQMWPDPPPPKKKKSACMTFYNRVSLLSLDQKRRETREVLSWLKKKKKGKKKKKEKLGYVPDQTG